MRPKKKTHKKSPAKKKAPAKKKPQASKKTRGGSQSGGGRKPRAGAKPRGIPDYGVLRGVIVEHGREDADQDSPHLQVIVEANGERWRCAVNVLSSEKKDLEEREVFFAVVDPLTRHPVLGQLNGIGEGFTPLPGHAAGRTLDFVREPLFQFEDMQRLPFFGPGEGDDLQDLLELFVNKAEGRPASSAEVFVWGARFKGGTPRPADRQFRTRQGVHDIHMNQGNPTGTHFKDNGIFQDGGIIFRFTNPDRFVGFFLRFASQSFQTDEQGAPRLAPVRPQAIEAAIVSRPPVAIVGAVVHPVGDQIGNESVTLLNTLAQPINLAGWTIQGRGEGDGDGRDTLDGIQLRAGEARTIVLTGRGATLGDGGGAIALRNRDEMLVHSVTYSQEDAAEAGRTIVF
ncbi:MAG: DUF2278 family protein [Thermoanaerobaculia bacterium]